MPNFDDINDMIRKELESDKKSVDSISNALSDRLENLVESLVRRTLELGKRQFYASFPMSLDENFSALDDYDDDPSPLWRAREQIRQEDWTGHLSQTFGIDMNNRFENITFQEIISILEGIFGKISAKTVDIFGELNLMGREGDEVGLGNYYIDDDGDCRSSDLTFPDFFVKKSTKVPVFLISTEFELMCGGYSVPIEDDGFGWDGFFHTGDLHDFESDKYMKFTGEHIKSRLNYFTQFH